MGSQSHAQIRRGAGSAGADTRAANSRTHPGRSRAWTQTPKRRDSSSGTWASVGSPTRGDPSSRSPRTLSQYRGEEISRDCASPSRPGYGPGSSGSFLTYSYLARGAVIMTHPLFGNEFFIETPFAKRFQATLRSSLHKRSWHVIVADPGSGKTLSIRDLIETTGSPAILAVTCPKNNDDEQALGDQLFTALGVKLPGHWRTRKPKLISTTVYNWFSQLSGEVDGIHDGYPIMDLEEKTLTL